MDIEKARETLEKGGIVIYPTETAYGIGAKALDEKAVEKVYEAKNRPRDKPLTVICSSIEQVERYAVLTGKERKLIKEFMPGPLTLVVEKKEIVPDNLNEKFVFRISSSDTARELAREFPVTATSANISGQDTSYSVEEIDPELKDSVDHILDSGKLESSPTSTIAEVNNGEIVIHRRGPVKRSDMEKVLNE